MITTTTHSELVCVHRFRHHVSSLLPIRDRRQFLLQGPCPCTLSACVAPLHRALNMTCRNPGRSRMLANAQASSCKISNDGACRAPECRCCCTATLCTATVRPAHALLASYSRLHLLPALGLRRPRGLQLRCPRRPHPRQATSASGHAGQSMDPRWTWMLAWTSRLRRW